MPSAVESQHVFLAVCHPLDGLSEGHGEVGDGDIFGEDTTLLAKATPDIRRDDAHLALWPVEELGQLPPHPVRSLGGGPDGEEVLLGLVVGHQATRFERHWGQPLHLVALPDDPIRLGKGGVEIVALAVMADAERDVGSRCAMDRGGVLSRRFQRIEDGGSGS